MFDSPHAFGLKMDIATVTVVAGLMNTGLGEFIPSAGLWARYQMGPALAAREVHI